MENEKAQKLAEQIVELLQNNQKGNDEFLRSSLEKINARLDNLESQMTIPESTFQIPHSKPIHVSQEKFANLEELADEIIANLQNEKACQYEPTGKLCDHCAMCNSRGF